MAYYDKDKIKNALSIDDIFKIAEHLGGEPVREEDSVVLRTICHNGSNSGSEKLFYYPNTKLFNCYTGCGSMDIFELVTRVKEENDGTELSFYEVMDFVAKFFNLEGVSGDTSSFNTVVEQDMDIISSYKMLIDEREDIKVTYDIYDSAVLDRLSQMYPSSWVREGIKTEVMEKYGIKYYATDHKIVIPHYNIKNALIGIRGRALREMDVQLFGKYMPLKIGNKMYNHPLSLNLYGLNFNLKNINKIKKIIIFEGEKSVMLYESMFGAENNIAVATCGSSLSLVQEAIIRKFCDVDEVIIAYDKEFEEIGDNNFKKNVAMLERMADRLKNYYKVSVLFDKNKDNPRLEYKDAPIDKGKEVMEELFRERIFL